MRKIFTLLIVAILATATSWAATTGTIKFGTNDVKIDKASVTAADDQGNSWEITTVGTEYFGQQSQYTQVGSASAPATSITFTTKLSKEVKVSSLSAKFGGFKGTAGTIKLSVGSTEVGTGNLSATKDVTVTSTSGASGTQLTVTVTNIAKGVKCYNITYTYEDSPEPQKTPTTLSFGEGVDGQTFTKYIGEKGFTYTATLSPVVEGATIDYSSTDENVAFVLDGEVELQKKEGVATIKASYAGNDTYEKSEASYTIDLKKLPISFSIPSGTAVVAGTKVTLSTIEGATLMYQIDGGNPVDVNSNTTDITIEKGCTIEAVASYNGANEGAQATYSIKEVKTITSFEISGTPSKTNYYVGEAFDYSGLKASATFSDNTTEDVTANATWTLNPASFTDATQNEVTVTATYEGATDTKTYPVTVTAIE
ncbi:MAG: bacterial Ig-like domain-containing protein, partial [Sodaliphilus sp.]|nr:bacterial Ig-like domain-containing protein [Sodaliphilus sp.]